MDCSLLVSAGKKSEETMKPSYFSSLYVESDQYSSPVKALNLIVDSESQPVELNNSTIGVTGAVEAKEKLAIILFCAF